MKKYILIVLLLGSTLSCDKGFLDKKPIENASIETLFATAEDLGNAVNGVYDVFQGGGDMWGGSFFHITPHFDAISEDAIYCCDWEGQYANLARGTITPSSGGIVGYKWGYGYKGIARVNSILANINRTDLTIDADTRLQYEAEVKFLRGLMYFELTTHYGGVPLLLKPVDLANAMVPRNTKEEVIAAVIDDLNFASQNLGTTPFNNVVGKPTKFSAYGLLARVYLYNSKWSEAAAAAKAVIDKEAPGVVALSTNYEGLFDGTNKADKEVLFDVQYVGPKLGEGSYLAQHYGPNGVDNGGGWGSLSYQETMFDAFYMTDGLPTTSSPLYNPANPYANRDKRLYWSFFVPNVTTWQGKTYAEENYRGSIAALPLNTKKWVTTVDQGEDGNSNLIILRYADVLLMYAEAQNELGIRDASVYSAINKVRARAQMPPIPNGLTKDQMTEIIRRERKVELSQEGLRFFDLVRWGIAAEKINSNKREPNRKWRLDTHTVLPIPQSEMDANKNLVQNPNY
jgi:starch-binding outer membrane protein, SusD/RagB family